MICKHCGNYVAEDSLTCERCGTMVTDGMHRRESGVRSLRQGRAVASLPSLPDDNTGEIREYGGDERFDNVPLPSQRPEQRRKNPLPELTLPSRPTTRRGLPVNTKQAATRTISGRQGRTGAAMRKGVNWTRIGIIITAFVILAVAGYMVYQKMSPEGQRATARKLTLNTTEAMFTLMSTEQTDVDAQKAQEELLKDYQEAPADAYWRVGQALMDEGDVDHAIMAYRLCAMMEEDNYDVLYQLGAAYEAIDDKESAERVYLSLVNEVSPSRSDAYTALIRMYQEQERNPEAADMMLKAYENTDKENYRLQRKDFIPNMPTTSLSAGRYKNARPVTLTSPQGYDIYYTLDDEAVLPSGGTLVQGEIMIPEGALTLRAVCVSEDLVSDPMAVTYTIYYPSPAAPMANLAPGTYDKPKTVSLRAGSNEDTKADKDDELAMALTFHYTIDGSTPTLNSPIYDGTPIKLPNGRVDLRAIAVNGYGKVSSTREVDYKITCTPYMEKIYSEDDKFSNLAIYITKREDFESRFGKPKKETDTSYLATNLEAKQLDYDWGYAVFTLNGTQWLLTRIEMNSMFVSGPRGVGIGSSESEVVAAYRDMGQPANLDGTRGLYYADPNIGSITNMEDGTRMVEYSCSTKSGRNWCVQYQLKDGRVFKIAHFYQP